jgi:hypothetical protein
MSITNLLTASSRSLMWVGMGLMGFGASAGIAQTLPAERHPSLLFDAGHIETMKERIQRAPYSSWWQTVLSRAQSAPSSFTEERTKARVAKSLAFAYLMTDDENFAQQAVDVLKQMKFPPRDGDLGEPHNEGEVVALYAVAYDMIHNFAASDPESLAEIRDILAEEAERLRKGIVIQEVNVGITTLKIRLHETPDPRNPNELHLDNWHVRAYGGLGLAALALSDHPGIDDRTPQNWADRAFDLVTRSLAHQIDEEDGGYAEGPFYSRYAADVYLPYMFALKNVMGIDLFDDPQIAKMHDWSVNLRLPDGRRPNIEDGHLDDFYGHYLAAVDADGPVHLWDWLNNGKGLYVREFSEMDAIALYDDSVVPTEPNRGPSIFMPGAGDAVFRSSWGSDATYMLLRGEHGRARAQGLGHEHPDETSFIIYAAGEMLALDSGYINFTNHSKVNQGRNHNVVLVDGEGPPNLIVANESIDGGNDAFIENTFVSPFMDYAEVRAAYAGVDVRRSVMFADHSYFIITDELRDDLSHVYQWRLHGHGGGSSGGSYARTGNLARWSRSQAELLAFVHNAEDVVFSERDTIHSFGFLQEPTHTVLLAEKSGSDVDFLSVIYPRADGQSEPGISGVDATLGQVVQIAHGEDRDFAWLEGRQTPGVEFASPAGGISSDGHSGLVRLKDGVVAGYALRNGGSLIVGGDVVFTSTEPIDASVEVGSTLVEGYLRGPENGYRVRLPLMGTVESASFTGTLNNKSEDGEFLTLDLAGEGTLTVGVNTAISVVDEAKPRSFTLAQNYPNPFNAETIIPFQIPREEVVSLAIYNLQGQLVSRLVNGPLAAGTYRVIWKGVDRSGVPMGSGVYLYRISAGGQQITRRMMLVK